MTTSTANNVSLLLGNLKDPFTLFPIEDAISTLCKAVDEAERWKAHRMGRWGVARKYWSVEEEHYHEVIGFLVGSIFVLGQASITQTVSILNELRRHPQAQSVIPDNKMNKLVAHAEIEAKTRLSKIVIINAVSNYFKHIYEWPQYWDTVPVTGAQAETISIVLKLGMKPREMTDNLLLAANSLGLFQNEPRTLAKSIQEWREGWTRKLYPIFGLTDPDDIWDEDPWIDPKTMDASRR